MNFATAMKRPAYIVERRESADTVYFAVVGRAGETICRVGSMSLGDLEHASGKAQLLAVEKKAYFISRALKAYADEIHP